MDISDIRERIDEIDSGILRLFAERMEMALRVADHKREHGLPTLDAARERQVIERARAGVPPHLADHATGLLRALMRISRSYQDAVRGTAKHEGSALAELIRGAAKAAPPDAFSAQVRVACQGVKGAYSQIACKRVFARPEIVWQRSFEDVCRAVSSGDCRYGVLPAENSCFGSVVEVYDLMARYDFYIARSHRLRVAHCLLAPRGASIKDVRVILSHPQAIGQCGRFLASRPDIRVEPCSNTAAAALAASESGRGEPVRAAIASRACAELYGLDILNDNICDDPDNYTRFLVITREPEIHPGASRVSLLTELDHSPGSLCGLLTRFTDLDLNLTKIESRPIPGRGGEYRFICDIEASALDASVVSLLCDLDAETERFRFLGCYIEDDRDE